MSNLGRTSLLGVSGDRSGDEGGSVHVDVLHIGDHLVQLGLCLDDAVDALLRVVGRHGVGDVDDDVASVVLDLLDSVGDLHDGPLGRWVLSHYIPCDFCDFCVSVSRKT